ncbi:hypothetical protein ACHAXS_001316, partial [Conticribra weissflogii]
MTMTSDDDGAIDDATTTTTTTTTTTMQAFGREIILSAAKAAGATEKMISIDWKSERIVVTVDVRADE